MELKSCPFRVQGERKASCTIPGEYYYNETFMPCLKWECPCYHEDTGDAWCDRNGAYIKLNNRVIAMADLISRAAAIDAIVSATAFPDAEYIKNLCQNPANSEDWLGGVCDAINAVEDVNTVDAVPVVHGRWIGYPECLGYDGAYHDEHIVCSECHSVWNIIDNDTERFDYCPHCGAEMDKED